MLLSADSLTIIFVKNYCYWTRTVGVTAKGIRGPVFFETQCRTATQDHHEWQKDLSSLQTPLPWRTSNLSEIPRRNCMDSRVTGRAVQRSTRCTANHQKRFASPIEFAGETRLQHSQRRHAKRHSIWLGHIKRLVRCHNWRSDS